MGTGKRRRGFGTRLVPSTVSVVVAPTCSAGNSTRLTCGGAAAAAGTRKQKPIRVAGASRRRLVMAGALGGTRRKNERRRGRKRGGQRGTEPSPSLQRQ